MRARFVAIFTASVVFAASPHVFASRLAIKSGNDTGGGTVVSNGSTDVKTSNGGAAGDSTLWLDLGFASPSDFLVIGSYSSGPDVFTSTELSALRVIATVEPSCSTCPFTINQAKLGGSIPDGTTMNVAGYWNLTLEGGGLLPITMNQDTVYRFVLPTGGPGELQTILDTYGADHVSIGLAAQLFWPGTGGNTSDPRHPTDVSFETVGTPEPASLILLGSGLVGLAGAARARRKGHKGPAAPDKMKLPQ